MPEPDALGAWRFEDVPVPSGAIVTGWGGIIDPGLNFLHPLPAAAAAYWHGKVGADGRLPGRRDIDPRELRPFMPNVMLLERDRAGGTEVGRMRVRLIGTATAEHLGEITGRWLDEVMPPESFQRFVDPARIRLERRIPTRMLQRSIYRNRTWVIVESFTGSLASDGVNIDMFFGVHATWSEDQPPPEVVAATAAQQAATRRG